MGGKTDENTVWGMALAGEAFWYPVEAKTPVSKTQKVLLKEGGQRITVGTKTSAPEGLGCPFWIRHRDKGGEGHKSRFAVVSTWNTVYSCVIIYWLLTIFHMHNCKPMFAPPCTHLSFLWGLPHTPLVEHSKDYKRFNLGQVRTFTPDQRSAPPTLTRTSYQLRTSRAAPGPSPWTGGASSL